MQQHDSIAHIKIKRFGKGLPADADDELAVEEPLQLQLTWYNDAGAHMQKNIAVTMRTPGHDEELAAGFLFTEGILQQPGDILGIYPGSNNVLVALRQGAVPKLQQAERNFYTTSSCGVCGKTGIDAIKTVAVYRNEPGDLQVPAALFYGLQQALQPKQVLFESTGGLHASALFDINGNCLLLREDVGRHNALDKLIGAAFLNKQLPLHRHILLLSGRAGFELIQKATMAGIRIVAAVGAPSSLAVELAGEAGITLIGFLRDERYNVYSGVERISQ
jgi:FdhD protein